MILKIDHAFICITRYNIKYECICINMRSRFIIIIEIASICQFDMHAIILYKHVTRTLLENAKWNLKGVHDSYIQWRSEMFSRES
jgi:hypothetical protein